MTTSTKQEIFKEKLQEYLKADKPRKGRILDAVSAVTKCDRKSAIRRFKTIQLRPSSWQERRGRKKVYDHQTTAALKEVWEAANRICAERLHPVIPEYVRILKRDEMWHHDEDTTNLLLTASLGTLKNRIAKFENIKRRGGRGTTKSSDLKEIIPIRRGPWQNPPPGFGEVDSVAHCGHTISGDFSYTVQYTDVATIWTVLAAQWNKGEEATLRSIERIKTRLPFHLLGIDPDSGSEFINWHLKEWCDISGVKMTRTRPYMKNDHARIEQKNYANIRHIVGYTRFDDLRHVEILNELYGVLEDYINFFVPSLKCVEKVRILSRKVRRYDTAQTAYQRVLANSDIDPEVKKRLRQKYATLNPLNLKQKCDQILRKLIKIPTRLR
jgi:hypothetical protein